MPKLTFFSLNLRIQNSAIKGKTIFYTALDCSSQFIFPNVIILMVDIIVMMMIIKMQSIITITDGTMLSIFIDLKNQVFIQKSSIT